MTLARTSLGRAGRGTTAALLIASNIPDIDIVTLAGGGVVVPALAPRPDARPARHRRPRPRFGGHGVAVAAFPSQQKGGATPFIEPPRASFRMLAAISIVGVFLHVLMDLPTSYGTRVLSPFDWHWFAVDWMPIVDIYLLVALVAGLLFGAASAAARRRNATIVLLLMAVNYGVRGFAHHEALEIAPGLFGALPAPCEPGDTPATLLDSWPRTPAAPSSTPRRRCLVEIAAMPTFLSPFTWRVIAQHLERLRDP